MTAPAPRRRRLTLGAAALALVVLTATPAAADDEPLHDPEDSVARYDEHVVVGADGVAHVTLELDMDFGSEPNRGPYLVRHVKARYDDTRDRVVRITDVEVTSSTGASTELDVEEDGAALVIRVGEEDRDDLTAIQSYRFTFTMEGVVNPAGYPFPGGALAQDELYLDVLDGWQIPVHDATVTLEAPVEATQVACRAGEQGSTASCATGAEGSAVTAHADVVEPGGALTVAAAYPAGTFDAEPILQDRWAFDRAFALTPATGGVTVGLLALGVALVLRRVRRSARDEEYRGLVPGLLPAAGQQATTGPRRSAPVAVRFTPPEGLRPGQLGTLVDERADPHDVTATIVDLAVRGYLRIERIETPDGEDPDWRLQRTDRDDADLLLYEHRLLTSLFEGRTVVDLSDLRTTFASSLARVQALLYEGVTQRGWFRGDPRQARAAWAGAGVALLVLGIAATVLLAVWTSWALAGLPLVVVGVLVLALTRLAPARTADGSAVLAQAEGFRLYLATAEAGQLRFEEGEDLFSRYLPYAVAFGLADRWARLFAELAAQGRAVAQPDWYVGWGPGLFWYQAGAFGSDLASFTSAVDTAVSAPSPGTSGSSGFSGGFAGGGVGGGGGGSW